MNYKLLFFFFLMSTTAHNLTVKTVTKSIRHADSIYIHAHIHAMPVCGFVELKSISLIEN